MPGPLLDLDDRSARLIAGRAVWATITPLLKSRRNIQAAVAFIGANHADLLPLQPPSSIIVNAGEDAITQGSTDPRVLLRWMKTGVKVYSLPDLHAKLIVAEGDPPFVIVGSANASLSSAASWNEAVLLADEYETVQESRQTIIQWRELAGNPLTEQWLADAVSRFNTRSRAGDEDGAGNGRDGPAEADPDAVDPDNADNADWDTDRSGETDPDPDVIVEIDTDTDTDTDTDSRGDTDGETDGDTGGDDAHPAHPDPAWPRPKTVYLVSLTRDGEPSAEAVDQYQRLTAEFGIDVNDSGRTAGTFSLDLFWIDEPVGYDVAPNQTYPVESHVVAVEVDSSGRIGARTAIAPPGRVLYAFTDSAHYPTRRNYYYLLRRWCAPDRDFSHLRRALAAVGEKPRYIGSYLMESKVNAILGLWPDARYDE